MKRLGRFDIPDMPTECRMNSCVYCENGNCDTPRINKGNGDAKCHSWGIRKLLTSM